MCCLHMSAEESVLKVFKPPLFFLCSADSEAAFPTDIPENCSSFVRDLFPLLLSLVLRCCRISCSCCIFRIGCWVALHCPIVLFFFFCSYVLRFRCKEEVGASRRVIVFQSRGLSLSPPCTRMYGVRAAKWISRAKKNK